ncbi:MAG: rhodanese-like domain-containing protein [Gammaproteobacteria bacterium]|nr:rhodanese-like domain-containing protein [Gammaproteobacteria bacterium]
MSEIKIKDISPAEAWQMLEQSRAVLLDVRTTMEYQYVGHPVGAVLVPWKEPPDWEVDPQFVSRARAALAERAGDEPVEEMPVLTICRSGKRSLAAAEALARQGFREVYNIGEGFEGNLDEKGHRNTVNGWRFNNLPWEQT